jgi:hypothetical protein
MATAIMLGGCLPTPDSASLQAVSPDRPASLGCSACHRYALQDRNHFTHLIYNEGVFVKQANGVVTCLDCHSTSLQSTTGILLDSVYRDSDGTLRSSVDFQGAFPTLPGILIRIDTLEQHHPIPLNDKALKEHELREWVTGLAHMNGKVEVIFDAAASDTGRFHGARAEFNPKLETCSAVSCHSKDGPYRFEACSKNLPGLVGEGQAYLCDGKP